MLTARTDAERVYIGLADPYFTLTDERNGYAETRRHLAGYPDADLLRAYREALRSSFDRFFGHNARKFGNLVVDELHARGLTQYSDIFGLVTVTRFRE